MGLEQQLIPSTASSMPLSLSHETYHNSSSLREGSPQAMLLGLSETTRFPCGEGLRLSPDRSTPAFLDSSS